MHGQEIATLRPALTRILAASPNFRDLGGLTAGARRVRQGVLYRSGALDELECADLAALGGLGIGLCFDLRSQGERQRHPSRWPAGSVPRILAIEVATDIRALDSGTMQYLIDHPDVNGAARLLRAIYRNMPTSCAPVLRIVFDEVAALGAWEAALIHCTAGKDRTGFVVAMVLQALGVAEADIHANYLESNYHYNAARDDAKIASLLEGMFDISLDRAAMQAITAARLEYLEAACNAIREAWGGIEAYLEQCCGLSARRRARLREALLE